MAHTIYIPPNLRKFTGGQDAIKVQRKLGDYMLGDVLAQIEESYPGIKARLLDQEGKLRHTVTIFIDSKDAKTIANPKDKPFERPLPNDPLVVTLTGYEEITILPTGG